MDKGPAIGAHTILPAQRTNFEVVTADAVRLVGELALPPDSRRPRATLLLLHPLPTEGGNMDSHLFRKAAWRLPALADLAVVRFNTRGTSSPLGTSGGQFGGGSTEAADLEAMVRYAQALEAPPLWLVGWSFGSEVALMHGSKLPVEGVIALSPPLKKTQSHHLIQWAATRKPVVGIVPENDQYLKPAEARARLAMLPAARVVEGAGAGHLWIGEKAVRQALNAVVEAVQPGLGPLPTNWDGPRQTYQNPK